MRIVSVRTWVMAAFGIVASYVSLYWIQANTVDGITPPLIGNLPSIIIQGVGLAVMVYVVTQLGLGQPIGRQWAWLTAGSASFWIGSAVWAYYEVVLGQPVPFPGLSDLFYLALYPLAAIGLFSAVRAFGKLFDTRVPLALAAAVAAVATGVVYFAVFQTIATDEQFSAVEKIISFFYPLGDIWLLLFPAAALALTASQLRGGRLAWPWWVVVLGYLMVAAADVMFTVGTWDDTYQSGSVIDMGWWLGFSAVAVAASLMLDVQRPRDTGEGVS